MSDFDKETIAEIETWPNIVVELEDLRNEAHEIVELLREHIDDGTGKPVCGAEEFEIDLLVVAALHSDCDACRGKRMIGNTKDHKQRDMLEARQPQPMADADTILNEKQKRSDGR